MTSFNLLGTSLALGDAIAAMPEHANDDKLLMEEWYTPAEFVQWLRRCRDRASRRLAADASLWECPKHRRHRTSLDAIERCFRWQVLGER